MKRPHRRFTGDGGQGMVLSQKLAVALFLMCAVVLANACLPPLAWAEPGVEVPGSLRPSELPFLNEELNYTVRWSNFINAGSAQLIFAPGTYKNDTRVLTARAIAKSADWMKVLGIDVEDRIETRFDPNFRFSYFFHANIKETDYLKMKTITFDWENRLVEYIDKNEKPAYFNLEGYTHDVLSALYYARTLPFAEGGSYNIRVFDDGKEYLLAIQVLKREALNLQGESIPAWKTKIIMLTKGIFNRKGDVFIWFSDDPRRIPVQMRCDIFLGFFHVEIADARAFFHYR